MQLIIKSLSGVLEEEEKKIIRKKLLWFGDHLPNNAVMTVGIKQHITKKSNQAFEVIVHLNAVKIKKPIYVRIIKNNLTEAIDVVKAKIERIVLKAKDKRKFKLKMPRFALKRKNVNS